MAPMAMAAARRLLQHLSSAPAARRLTAPNSSLQFARAMAIQLPKEHHQNGSAALRGLQEAKEIPEEKVPEEEEEVKEVMPGSWVVKGLVLAMLTYIGMNVAPMMGENMVRHSISLVKVKDHFMRRSGASRLTLIATDDAKRKKIVDAGGVRALVRMLATARDDDTRREALTTLAALSPYGPAVEAIEEISGIPIVSYLAETTTDDGIREHCTTILEKFNQLNANKA